jgi:mono/diheme cytochrome c family protein
MVAATLAVLGCSAQQGPDPQGADSSDPRLVARGETLYQQHCASCHGANLEGQPNWRHRQPDGTLLAPPHDASGHTWHHPDDMLFEITKWGTDAVVPGPNKSNMPGFSETLGDEDVWAVLAYIKSRWPQELRDAQPPGRGGETAGSSP